MKMDGCELDLALSNQIQDFSTKKKRSFQDSFSDDDDDDDDDVVVCKRTLPLLIWDHTPQTPTTNNREERCGDVEGWPPVKSWMKKLHRLESTAANYDVGSKSMYVKVEMEGIGIARKIDLSAHHSYQSLTPTLTAMFGKRGEEFELTYQDEEGDWLLAGDVPWERFLGCVRRLKLVRIWTRI